jgi:hypothetical protein
MRVCLVAIVMASSGCANHPVEFGQEAEGSLLTRPIEQVLQCLGPPDRQMQSGITSTWSYDSAQPDRPGWDGRVAIGDAHRDPPLKAAISFDDTSAPQRQCTMNIIMKGGYVSSVSYTDPAGKALPEGARCPFAVMAWCPKITAQSNGQSNGMAVASATQK